jgi:transposase-like protein
MEEREVFRSSILPKYLRKTKSIEELVPWLYLKGISTNDFPEALQSLLGKDAKGFSATTIAVVDDFRESKLSWNEVLLSLKARGLRHAPQLVVGDGALGFWKALEKVFPTTRVQGCIRWETFRHPCNRGCY